VVFDIRQNFRFKNMAVAIAPKKRNFRKGHGRPWENPWDVKSRENAGISLEELAREFKPTRNGHKDMAYVLILPGISASSPISNPKSSTSL